MKLKELIKFINDIAKKIKPYCEIAKETKKKIKEIKKNDSDIHTVHLGHIEVKDYNNGISKR